MKTDAAVFDQRFRDLTFQEIDLSRLWIDRGALRDRDPVQINNTTFSDIADTAKDGVVNLYTQRLEEHEMHFGISPNDILPIRIPILSQVFDVIPFKVPIPYQAEGFSLGSGFIINTQGYILTNAHVIFNATDIQVVLADGRKSYPGKIIGMDRLTDIALLKIEPDRLLRPLPLGNSDALRIGEMVLAMGNPFGLQHSVTSGIVSAAERVGPQLNDKLVDFIQTDTPINPGSSGGPLLNLYGEVVGVNTAIAAEAQSIGFTIPINTVKEIMPMLVLGRTERGWLGVEAAPLTLEKAWDLNYPQEEKGILILRVMPGSPAEKLGLQPQDIITALDGMPVQDFVHFRRKLLGLAPGRVVRLTVFRDGAHVDFECELIEKPSEPGSSPGEGIEAPTGS